MHKHHLFFAFIALPFLLAAQPKIQLKEFASGFTKPVDITHCGDSRLFIVEQNGYIWIVDTLGNKSAQPFLDIDARVQSSGNEQGLLGLAFHPNYAQNGYFYVYYTKNNGGDTRVARFSRDSVNINKADPNSEQVILEEDQPFANHNGGSLKFSPKDGYLYIGLGDGGSAGDPNNTGQKKSTFLGKILRIDVTPGATPYTVPANNPFVGNTEFKPEIWSWGWRNPWRFSFDLVTGDFWIGDVGQNVREEIDFEPAGVGGRNYGWRCYEGNAAYNTAGCQGQNNYTAPIFDYTHTNANGCSVTGGFIYRGAKYPDLYGCYLFADYCSGRWWYTRLNADGITGTTNVLANLTPYEYSGFGEDLKGELYVAALSSGKIYKITELCSDFKLNGTVSGPVCEGTQAGFINLSYSGATGTVGFTWSNNANTQNITGLNPGSYIVAAVNSIGCTRRDTFTVESASPTAPLVSVVSGAPVYCLGDTVLLEASLAPAGYGYQWYFNGNLLDSETTQQYTTTVAGNYTAAYTALGCNSQESGITTVNFSSLPVVQVTGDSVLCSADSNILEALNVPQDYAIQWFTVSGGAILNATDHKLTVTEGGFYYFEATGLCGTAAADLLQIKQEVINLPFVFQLNDTLLAQAGYESYQWLLNGIPIQGANTAQYVPEVSGLYECLVYTTAGCSYTDGLQVDVVAVKLPASVEHFVLAPNPSSGLVNLKLDLKKSEHIQFWLTDSNNRQIFMQTMQGQNFSKMLELNALPAGNYFLHIQLEQGLILRKIVKN